VAELRVDTRAAGTPPEFSGPTEDLVYFLSFAVAERYGATHQLSAVARVLRERPPRDALRPLLTFAEENPDDADDRADMEQIWQPAAPVAASAAWAADEIRASPRLLSLVQGFPGLLARLDDLARIAAWSAERGGDVRLLFRL
jgi:hypothetical protein